MKIQKIALVHDYLNEAGGAERVLRVLAEMYPSAPIYTAFVKRGSAREMFGDREIIESKWGWLLKLGRVYSYLRFMLPAVWRSVDLREYELVITSCSGYIARGFRVKEGATVVAYCHTPPKWLYGYETPTGAGGKWWGKMYLTLFGPFIRYFDYRSAQRVDRWIANSEEVKRRIEKFYRKEAVVIYPPAQIATQIEAGRPIERGEYYLVVARVTGAKGLVEAAKAAREMKRRLVVVGERVMGKKIEKEIKRAGGKWVELKGRVSAAELASLYGGARGYLATARDEDFGMTVVEAIARGTPVVALSSGGYKETVIPANRRIGESANRKGKVRTGILVDEFTVAGVVAGMRELERREWDREGMRKWAKRFGRSRFEREMRTVIG